MNNGHASVEKASTWCTCGHNVADHKLYKVDATGDGADPLGAVARCIRCACTNYRDSGMHRSENPELRR